MAAARQSARKHYLLPQTRHVTRETALLRRSAAPGESSGLAKTLPPRQGKARGGETPMTPNQGSVGPRLEWTKRASSPSPPRLAGWWRCAPGRAQTEGRGEPSARTAPERDLGSAAVAPARVDVSHGNAEKARARSRWAGCLAARASLPLRSGRRQPRGGIAQTGFTCRNAVPGIPWHRVFPRVTRGTFHPRHPLGDFFQAYADPRCSCSFNCHRFLVLRYKTFRCDYCTF